MGEWPIHVGVRDDVSNMKSAMKLSGIPDFSCMCQTLQLVLHDVLFVQISVEVVLRNAPKIVTQFEHSEQACHHLEERQLTLKVPVCSLLQDVEMRWNITYLMLERRTEQGNYSV